MAYCASNARSEFVIPSKPCVGFVVDTSFMFHAAVPASYTPGLRPTRGSGLGDGSNSAVLAPEAQAASDAAVASIESRRIGFMAVSERGSRARAVTPAECRT